MESLCESGIESPGFIDLRVSRLSDCKLHWGTSTILLIITLLPLQMLTLFIKPSGSKHCQNDFPPVNRSLWLVDDRPNKSTAKIFTIVLTCWWNSMKREKPSKDNFKFEIYAVTLSGPKGNISFQLKHSRWYLKKLYIWKLNTQVLTNSMAYGNRRFNAAFTRALQ